jgi:hypothetical protein
MFATTLLNGTRMTDAALFSRLFCFTHARKFTRFCLFVYPGLLHNVLNL